MFDLLAQAAPEGTLPSLLTPLGTAGITAFVLWRILQQREKRHNEEVDALVARITELTERLFQLADKSTDVAGRAQQVVERDSGNGNAELTAQLDRLAGLLERRGRP